MQIILRWHLQTRFVAIPKSTNTHHIEQNFDVLDFELSDDELTGIAAIDRNRSLSRMRRLVRNLLTRMAPIRDLP